MRGEGWGDGGEEGGEFGEGLGGGPGGEALFPDGGLGGDESCADLGGEGLGVEGAGLLAVDGGVVHGGLLEWWWAGIC